MDINTFTVVVVPEFIPCAAATLSLTAKGTLCVDARLTGDAVVTACEALVDICDIKKRKLKKWSFKNEDKYGYELLVWSALYPDSSLHHSSVGNRHGSHRCRSCSAERRRSLKILWFVKVQGVELQYDTYCQELSTDNLIVSESLVHNHVIKVVNKSRDDAEKPAFLTIRGLDNRDKTRRSLMHCYQGLIFRSRAVDL